jgi:hypothetical protein
MEDITHEKIEESKMSKFEHRLFNIQNKIKNDTKIVKDSDETNKMLREKLEVEIENKINKYRAKYNDTLPGEIKPTFTYNFNIEDYVRSLLDKSDKLLEINETDPCDIVKENIFTTVPSTYNITSNGGLILKGVKSVMTTENKFYFSSTRMKSYLGTMNFDPSIPLKEAWGVCTNYLSEFVNELIKSKFNIHYIGTAIEYHSGNDEAPAKKKKTTKKEEKPAKSLALAAAKAKAKAAEKELERVKAEALAAQEDRGFDLYSMELINHLAEKYGHVEIIPSNTTFDPKDTREMQKINILQFNAMDYTIKLNNLVTHFLYMKGKSIDSDSYQVLELLQDETSTCMLNGIPYSFEVVTKPGEEKKYKDDRTDEWVEFTSPDESYIIRTFESMLVDTMIRQNKPLKLSGWPHIHICLLLEADASPDRIEFELNQFSKCMNLTDIRFDRKRGEGKIKGKKSSSLDIGIRDESLNPLTAVQYIIKNHASQTVYQMLTKYGEINGHFINSYINIDSRYANVLLGLLEKISYCDEQNIKLCANIHNQRNNIACQSVHLYHKVQNSKCKTYKIPIEDYYMADPQIEDHKYLLEYSIQKDMEDNNFLISDESMYQMIPGSKSSSNYIGTCEEYLKSLRPNKRFKFTKARVEELLGDMSENLNDKFALRSIGDSNLITYRKIKINFRLVEFGDFYLNLEAGKIYKNQSSFHTYKYFPEITFDSIEEKLNKWLEESLICKYLKNSGTFNLKTFYFLNKSLVKRVKGSSKHNALSLMGKQDTGKSTLLRFVESLFPESKIGRIEDITAFDIYYRCKDKEMVLGYEGLKFMESLETSRDSILKMLEAEKLNGNKKHGDMTTESSSYGMIIVSNMKAQCMNFVNDSAVAARVNYIHYEIQDASIVLDALTDDIVDDELPFLLLFMCMCRKSYEHLLPFIPLLQTEENLEGVDLTIATKLFKHNTLVSNLKRITDSFDESCRKYEYKEYNANFRYDLLPKINHDQFDDRLVIKEKLDADFKPKRYNPMSGPSDGYETDRIN